MLVAAAVVPHPPALVPEVTVGAAPELDDLRAACDEAVAGLLAARPDVVVAVAAGEPGTQDGTAAGSLAPYGLPAWTCGGDGSGGTLGLGHTICAWLLDRSGWDGPRVYAGADGRPLDLPDGRVALLVAADGSARRSEQAPGYLDARAAPFDAALAAALASGDATALAGLDLDLAAGLWAHGAPALVTLGTTAQRAAADRPVARLVHDAAPYGVGYLCATWRFGLSAEA